MRRRIAISYSRFSDPKQAEGDSESRQEREFRGFCSAHNLTPLSEVYADRGRSGFKDEHRKRGRLGQLVQAAKNGQFERGTVIVVEAWDRLGRLRPDKQTDLIAELLRTGVDIGICRLNDIFTESDFGTHKWAILSTFIMLAYQESKQKSERGAAAWQRSRDKAREDGTPWSAGRIPAWLKRDEFGRLTTIPEAVKAVQRVFQLAADGYGIIRIAKTLESEGVIPPYGKGWNHTHIGRILSDRRALGELQPKRDGKPDGGVLEGYYPPIVSVADFALAREGIDRRRHKPKVRDRKFVNLFQSLLVSAVDGQTFFALRNRGTAGRPYMLLVSGKYRGKMQTFPYHVFEEAILRMLREIDPQVVMPQAMDAEGRLKELRTQLTAVRTDIAGLQDELKRGFSRALASVLREREADEERIAGELQDALAANARPTEKAWQEFGGLAGLVAERGDEARLRLRPILRSITQEIRLLIVRRGSWSFAAAQFFFTGGTVRNYLVAYRSGCFHQKSSWWVRSLAEVVSPTDLDMRKSDDANQLKSDLLKLDLEWLEKLHGGREEGDDLE
jgi:DNA invertase Pin-like site-specific DNA recombinase